MTQDDIVTRLSGANMDIDLVTPTGEISWEQSVCPWNAAEGVLDHRCAVKHTSICRYFLGIEYLDTVVCCYPLEGPSEDE